MITRLEEKGIKKAHQYWPTKIGKKLKMDNKISVKFESESRVDGLIKRTFTATLDGNN